MWCEEGKENPVWEQNVGMQNYNDTCLKHHRKPIILYTDLKIMIST